MLLKLKNKIDVSLRKLKQKATIENRSFFDGIEYKTFLSEEQDNKNLTE